MVVSDQIVGDVVVVQVDHPLVEGARLLVQRGIRHLPVVDGSGVLVGLLTDADVFRHGAFLDADQGWMAHVPEWDAWTCGRVAGPCRVVAAPEEDLSTALQRLADDRSDALVVVDPDRRPVGIVTEVDVLRLAASILDPQVDVGAEGSAPVHAVDVGDPAGKALWTMLEEGVRHLAITRGDRLHSVVSFRDLMREDVPRRPDLLAEELGSTPPVTAPEGLGLLDAAMRMEAHGIGCLPVVDAHRRLLRMVTRRDVLHAVVARLDAERLFPDPDPALSGFVGQIVTTHTAVDRFLRIVMGADAAVDLVRELNWLSTILPAHFSHEEADGGFFDRIAAAVPVERHAVDALRRDHAALLDTVAALRRGPGPSDADVRAFARRLADHEAEERRLSMLRGPTPIDD